MGERFYNSNFWGVCAQRRRRRAFFLSLFFFFFFFSSTTKKSLPHSYGIRGLVIDPYNELDHQRPSNVSETEYVSQMLTKIKRFAQHYDVATWFVCHPKQIQNWTGAAPNLYDISGSAHFVNKCDVGLVVHRVRDEFAQQQSPGAQVNDKVREGEDDERVEERDKKRERLQVACFSSDPLFSFFPFQKKQKTTPAQVQIILRKVRNKAAGTIGEYKWTIPAFENLGDEELGCFFFLFHKKKALTMVRILKNSPFFSLFSVFHKNRRGLPQLRPRDRTIR